MYATGLGEKRGLAVNLASRSGVVNKLSVTAEMSTTKHSDTDAIGGERGRSKGGKGSGVSKNGWGRGGSVQVSGHMAAILRE